MQHRPFDRKDRYGHHLQKILGDIFIRELNTSDIGLITISKVIVSKDLKIAKVYISTISEKYPPERVVTFIKNRKKFIRKCLGKEITNRNVPELIFFYDDTYEIAENIERIFSKLDLTGSNNK